MSFISTIINQSVIEPFVFRNYRHFPMSHLKSRYQGCGEVRIWEAMRASTAAPGYFEEMNLASYVHQVAKFIATFIIISVYIPTGWRYIK